MYTRKKEEKRERRKAGKKGGKKKGGEEHPLFNLLRFHIDKWQTHKNFFNLCPFSIKSPTYKLKSPPDIAEITFSGSPVM